MAKAASGLLGCLAAKESFASSLKRRLGVPRWHGCWQDVMPELPAPDAPSSALAHKNQKRAAQLRLWVELLAFAVAFAALALVIQYVATPPPSSVQQRDAYLFGKEVGVLEVDIKPL